jgi:nucleoside permease NupC
VIVLSTASDRASFVFVPLAAATGTKRLHGFFFTFQALPTIIFFPALVITLYYYGILPFNIRQFARAFTK